MPKHVSRPVNPYFDQLRRQFGYKDVMSIAEAAGMPHGTVLAYATGRTISGRPDSLERLAKAFGDMDPFKLSKGLKEGRAKLIDPKTPSRRGPGTTSSNVITPFRDWMDGVGIYKVSEVAERSGIKLTTLLNYTKGRSFNPSPTIILALARVFDVTSGEIIRRLAEERLRRQIALLELSELSTIIADDSPCKNVTLGETEINLAKNQAFMSIDFLSRMISDSFIQRSA